MLFRSILRDWTRAFDGLLCEDADINFPRWCTPLLARRGETVRYELQNGGVSGRIIGVDGLGRLHIEQTGGGERFIAPGDIQ